jgi:hypothetical protein
MLIESLPHSASLNIAGLVIAFAVAIVAFVTQLHDRISDLFRIRANFDRDKILLPLAKLVGAKLTPQQIARIDNNARHRLMREVFYPYTSSRAAHVSRQA